MKKMICISILSLSTSALAGEQLLTRENCTKIQNARMQVITGNPSSPENLKKQQINEELSTIQNRCNELYQ